MKTLLNLMLTIFIVTETYVAGQDNYDSYKTFSMGENGHNEEMTENKVLLFLQALQDLLAPPDKGTTFTVWGKATCPDTPGTQMVYSGLTAKSAHNNVGGGIDYQCLTKQPQYLQVVPGIQQPRSYITGVEYEDWEKGPLSNANAYGAPCAVCYTTARSVALMIPGRYECPNSWTREYYGYLTAERYNHVNPSTHICTHKDLEIVPGSNVNKLSGIMMHVEATCPAHLCPPYTKGNELTCVVCTK